MSSGVSSQNTQPSTVFTADQFVPSLSVPKETKSHSHFFNVSEAIASYRNTTGWDVDSDSFVFLPPPSPPPQPLISGCNSTPLCSFRDIEATVFPPSPPPPQVKLQVPPEPPTFGGNSTPLCSFRDTKAFALPPSLTPPQVQLQVPTEPLTSSGNSTPFCSFWDTKAIVLPPSLLPPQVQLQVVPPKPLASGGNSTPLGSFQDTKAIVLPPSLPPPQVQLQVPPKPLASGGNSTPLCSFRDQDTKAFVLPPLLPPPQIQLQVPAEPLAFGGNSTQLCSFWDTKSVGLPPLLPPPQVKLQVPLVSLASSGNSTPLCSFRDTEVVVLPSSPPQAQLQVSPKPLTSGDSSTPLHSFRDTQVVVPPSSLPPSQVKLQVPLESLAFGGNSIAPTTVKESNSPATCVVDSNTIARGSVGSSVEWSRKVRGVTSEAVPLSVKDTIAFLERETTEVQLLYKYLESKKYTLRPIIITAEGKEDVAAKIKSLANKRKSFFIAGTVGSLSFMELRQEGRTTTYEGEFGIISIRGTFVAPEDGGKRKTCLSVSVAGPGNKAFGGPVAVGGRLIAARRVQMVGLTFSPIRAKRMKRLQKHKQHQPQTTSLNQDSSTA